MPPYLAVPHFHLSRLPITTKVALTMFCLALVAAELFVVFAIFEERTHFRAEGVQSHFGGSDRFYEETGQMSEPKAEKSRREIYDIIHPHSFLMPVLFFILCHLMEMTTVPKIVKLILYIGSGSAMIMVIFAPILIWSSLKWGVMLVPAVVLMLVAFFFMTLLPPIQMWRGERA